MENSITKVFEAKEIKETGGAKGDLVVRHTSHGNVQRVGTIALKIASQQQMKLRFHPDCKNSRGRIMKIDDAGYFVHPHTLGLAWLLGVKRKKGCIQHGPGSYFALCVLDASVFVMVN